ncbi:MAG: hypothetical protein M1274_12415, partial [Actinobacteria bacterium]|nr:hypothetical protein [Actinomycetota bacterium]
MANENDSLDSLVMKLKRVDDKDLASLSHDPAAQALYEEVTPVSGQGAKNEAKPKRDTKRRRLIWEGAAVVAAAVVVLGVLSIVNVFGANGPSIVEKAVAALNPGDNAIVHVKITGHESDGGSYSSDWTEENWMRTSSPYTRRDIQAFDGSPPVETVQDSN